MSKGKGGTKQLYQDSMQKPLPPRRRITRFRLPQVAWSGTLDLSPASVDAQAEDGEGNFSISPSGLLIGGNGDQNQVFDVTLTAKAIKGYRANTWTKQVGVRRRDRNINWNLTEVWEVGEEITLGGINASCWPDYPKLELVEPTEEFADPADAVTVTVSAEETDQYRAWIRWATVKVVADRAGHAKTTALDGMKDGTLWKSGPKNGGTIPQLTDWNDDTGKLKTQGKEVMAAVKAMTPDQLIDYMDAYVKNLAQDKTDERLTKPTKQFPNVLWKLANGLQVRFKPKGDGFDSKPKFCVEVRTVPGFTEDQDDVAFKLSAEGEPAAPGASETLVPGWVTDANLYNTFMDTACSTTHLSCKPKQKQVITRPAAAEILAGVALKDGQLGIQALDKAQLTYKVASGPDGVPAGTAVTTGSKLAAGDYTIEATAKPTKLYDGGTETFAVTVTRSVPTITWAPPATEILVGTPLAKAGILNASASTGATVNYKRAANNNAIGGKSVLPPGDGQKLIAFVAETTSSARAEKEITVNVKRKKQTVTWALPKGVDPAAASPLGTKLFAAAVPSVPKTVLTFATDAGAAIDANAALPVGEHTLVATAPQTDEYEAAEARLKITVRRKSARLKWAQPGPVEAGLSLEEAGVLTASAAAGLTPQYRTQAGKAVGADTMLPVGTHTLVAWTEETDTYLAGEAPVTFAVELRAQEVTWEQPRNVEVGTALGRAGVLNATALGEVPVRYTNGGGGKVDANTTLAAGEAQILVAIADATEIYEAAEARVTINVRRVPQTITWAPPGDIAAGAKLDGVLNASALGGAKLSYSTADGKPVDAASTLPEGDGQRLIARSAETDTYAAGEAEVRINVKARAKAEQTV